MRYRRKIYTDPMSSIFIPCTLSIRDLFSSDRSTREFHGNNAIAIRRRTGRVQLLTIPSCNIYPAIPHARHEPLASLLPLSDSFRPTIGKVVAQCSNTRQTKERIMPAHPMIQRVRCGDPGNIRKASRAKSIREAESSRRNKENNEARAFPMPMLFDAVVVS